MKSSGKIIGAFTSAGRHSTFGSCSLKGNSFEKVTGQTLNEWFVNMIQTDDKKHGFTRGQYNQIANYMVTHSEINIVIGNKEPKVYFQELLAQCQGGPKKYGNITGLQDLQKNLIMNCIPDDMEKLTADYYEEFLEKRRKIMAEKISVISSPITIIIV